MFSTSNASRLQKNTVSPLDWTNYQNTRHRLICKLMQSSVLHGERLTRVSEVLKKWHELHIRWSSDDPDTVAAPFTSRVSPGLHVFYTPSMEVDNPDLCQDVRSVFRSDHGHFKCTTSNETAIKMPMLSERFTMSTALHYYSPFFHEDWSSSVMAMWIEEMTGSHVLPSYVDIDYDAISQAVICTIVWSTDHAHDGGRWTDTYSAPATHSDSTIEIGILSHEANTDPEDYQFGGFLTVLGRDDKPSTIPYLPAKHTTNASRTNALPNAHTTLPAPGLSAIQPQQNPATLPSPLQNFHQPPLRPAPHSDPDSAQRTPVRTRPVMQTAHVPDAAVSAVHRQIPIQRRFVSRVQESRCSTQSIRSH